MTRPPTTLEGNEPILTLTLSLVIAGLAYDLTSRLVPFLSNDLVQKGLRGKDMLKVGFVRKEEEEEQDDDDDGEVELLPGRKWM